MVLRLLVLAALAATIALAIRDVLTGTPGGPASLGEVWYALAPGSLNLAQAVVQRYISPALWDPVIIWVLGQPATAVSGLIAAALTALYVLRRRQT